MVKAEVIRNQKSLMMTRDVGDSLGLHEAMLGELRLIFLSRCITCDETLYKLVKTPSLSVNPPTKFFFNLPGYNSPQEFTTQKEQKEGKDLIDGRIPSIIHICKSAYISC